MFLTGVFTTLKQQLETTKIEEVKDSDYVFVLDSPSIPLIRSEPNKKIIVFSFGFLGVALSFFIILKCYHIRIAKIKIWNNHECREIKN